MTAVDRPDDTRAAAPAPGGPDRGADRGSVPRSGAVDGGLRATRLSPLVLAVAVLALLAIGLVSVLVGAADLSPGAVLAELVDGLPWVDVDSGLDARSTAILWQLRLPRIVLGGIVGASLAVAGAAYQGVFRNPLADPYLLGAAAGAGLAATLVITLDPSVLPTAVTVPLAAFVGALGGVALAVLVGRTAGGGGTAGLVLAGVAIASFLTAIQTFVQQRNADTLAEVYTWILGRLTTGGWSEVLRVLVPAAGSIAVIWLHRRTLDVLSVGEDEAATLGVDARAARIAVVVAASLATAAAVAVSGLIGFVGIVVPHAIRLTVGASYRIVLPLSVVVGAAFMIGADLLARTIVSPAELPIGVVTAFVGAPFFAILLRRNRQGVTM